eukprot:scaffold137_cov59-Phaeocystis_antarctica.AAC.1
MFNNSQHACTSDPRRVMTPSPSHPSEVQVHDLTHPTPARATTGLLWPSHLCGQQGRATRFICLCGNRACSVPPMSASKARETCHSAGPSASPLYLHCTCELLQLLGRLQLIAQQLGEIAVGVQRTRLLEQRPRLLQLAHGLQQQAQVADRDQRVRVAVAQRLPLRLQRLFEQRPRLLQLAHALQQRAQVVDRDQRVPVAVAQRLPPRLQRLLEQRPRLLQLAHFH